MRRLSVTRSLTTLLLASAVLSAGCAQGPTGESAEEPIPPPPPPLHVDDAGLAWTAQTLGALDLDGLVAQLFAVRVLGEFRPDDDAAWQETVRLVRDLGIGGVIFFQGSPVEQAALVNELQSLAPLPLLVSQDMEWGAGMRLDGATRFPVAMAMAATGDPDLAYRAGLVTAREARAVGVHQVFAPVADVNTNAANPVIDTRSFSDRPGVVSRFVSAYVRGIQDGGVHATIKHFPGHGETDGDSHDELPVIRVTAEELDSLHLPPFRAAIEAGVSSVMTAHVAYPRIDSAIVRPATLSRTFVQDLLRDRLGFTGLVVTDALTMRAVSRHTGPGEAAVRALEAGVDMLLMSEDTEIAHRAVVTAVREGRLDRGRIERSVRRILHAKAASGLHHGAMTDLNQVRSRVGDPRARGLAQRIARGGLTLLGGRLPVVSGPPGRHVLVVTLSDREGPAPDEAFRAALRAELPDMDLRFMAVDPASAADLATALTRRVREADQVIAAVFAGAGRWKKQPRTAAALSRVLDGLTTGEKAAPVVLFGTPYLLTDLARIPATLLVAYDGSVAMQQAAAGALAGSVSVSGSLPVTVPSAFTFGSGLAITAPWPHLDVPESAGMDGLALARIDSLIRRAIEGHAFPGAAVAVGRSGSIVYRSGFGYYTYDSTRPVRETSVFDMASLTKVIATTTAMMLLVEQGRIDLDAPVARYVPEFGRNGKEAVTVRHLLSHTGGLIPYRAFHRMGLRTREAVMEAIYDEALEYEPGTESRYSDFGPIVLAEVVERVTGQPFGTFVRTAVFEPLGMWHTGYRRSGAFDPATVPTEVDDYFRNRTLQGEVHDETAWILGGTAGHAGLFSTVSDLTRFATMMLNGGRIGDRPFLKPETIRLFTTAVDTTGSHTRALGWDTRSPDGPSSAGRLFGRHSYGHTGFTGTSLWIDPDADLFVILLTNRVYPTRENSGHVPVRAALADLAWSALRTPDASPLLPSVTD